MEGHKLGQALYRKYRSKKLSEIVGQEHITETLARAIKAGKISHAYLFTGPRGVGKTSIARILAHEVNSLPYTDESTHLDIIEIDAASNRRIDEIRDLRERVHIAPSSAKYKVYIIDEVHMLTKEAFNALLKTLEEPPAHVIFILATTEVHKLPETIISRTQRFTFKAIEPEAVIGHLRSIAEKEGIKVDDEALALLATHSGGSFRDAISLLDQVSGSKKAITKTTVEELLGVAPRTAVETLAASTLSGDPATIVAALDDFTARGIAPAQIAKQLTALLREQLLNGQASATPKTITGLLNALINVPASPDPASALEIALFEANLTVTPNVPADTVPTPIPKPTAEPATSTRPAKPADTRAASAATVVAEPVATAAEAEDISTWWPQLLKRIKQHNNTLYGVLRMAHPSLSGDQLQLSFAFGFHAKKMADAATAAKLQEAVKELTGRDVTIKTVHDKSLKGVEPNATAAVEDKPPAEVDEGETAPPELDTITAIFGGGEVLES